MNTLDQWKNLKETLGPDPAFKTRTRESLLRTARALGQEPAARSRMLTGFALGLSLAVAGLLAVSAWSGRGVGGALQARAPVFQIKIGEARYPVSDAAR